MPWLTTPAAPWKAAANCHKMTALERAADPFQLAGGRPTVPLAGRAWCANCPVVEECLRYAIPISDKTLVGVFGGATPKQRRRLRALQTRAGRGDELAARAFERGIVAHLAVLATAFDTTGDSGPAVLRHGLPESFAAGCRCTECSAANRVLHAVTARSEGVAA